MKRNLLLLAIIATNHAVAADPAPILAVREMNPWAMVIGSDSAQFAIYDDGSEIYLPAKPMADRLYARRQLDDPAKASEKLLGFDPEKMDTEYELSSATDQISTTIWTPEKRIEIYGNWREPLSFGNDSDPDQKAINQRERKMWETLPDEVRAFLLRVDKAREGDGDPWLPESVEVMLWPYDYAPGESIVWPASWPDLKAITTRKRGEESYSIYLPAKLLPDLKTFLATEKENGAVLINGKKMAVSFRVPLPSEEKWMK